MTIYKAMSHYGEEASPNTTQLSDITTEVCDDSLKMRDDKDHRKKIGPLDNFAIRRVDRRTTGV